MKALYFSKDGSRLEEDSSDSRWFLKVSEDLHVYFGAIKDGVEINAGPANFGAFYPYAGDALDIIIEELEKVFESSHFRAAWNKLSDSFKYEESLSSMNEENYHYKATLDSITKFSKLYTACFPYFASNFQKDLFMGFTYDGYYGVSYEMMTYRDYFSCIGYKDFVKSVYGIYRKDLAREAINLNSIQTLILSHFAKIKTLDPSDLYEASKIKGVTEVSWVISIKSFSTLECLPKSVLKKLLFQTMSENLTFEIEDTLEMLKIVGANKRFKGAKTWAEVHNIAMNLSPAITGEGSIELPETFKKVSEISAGNVRLTPMLKVEDFQLVGITLNICIGKSSYYKKSLDGESYSFVITKNNKIYGALEIVKGDRSWRTAQVSGEANCKIPEEDTLRKIISEIFEKEIGLTTEGKSEEDISRRQRATELARDVQAVRILNDDELEELAIM